MKHRKLTPIGLMLAVTPLLLAGAHDSHAQDITLDAVAIVGDPVPGGELTIRSLSEAAIDSSGRIVFRDPDFRVATIFQSTVPGAGLNRVPAEAADFTVDVDDPVFITFNATALNSTPIVNAAGTLAFTAAIFNQSRSVSINSVLFRGSSVTNMDDFARSDMLDLPGLVEVEFPGSIVAGIVGFAMNASGTVAFVTQPFGSGSGGAPRVTGVFIASGGTPTRIALDTEQAPGAPSGAVFGGFDADSLAINANGDVAFLGFLEQGMGGVTSGNSAGIWVFRNGSLRLVARQGDDVPGSAAGDLFAGFFGMSISPTGEVAFQGRTEASTSPAGIWRGTNTTDLRAVSVDGRTSRGELQPTSLGVSVGLGSFSAPVFTEAGDLLFIANGGPVESAIWMDDDGTLRPVLRGAVFEDGNISIIMPGDEATGTGGNFSTFHNFVANGEGRVAFTASYIGPLQSASFSVWAQDSAGVPRLVGQQSDIVQTPDGPKTIQRITFLSGRGNASGYGSGFSDAFQLAVSIDFQGGGSGIFRATVDNVSPPPPPPSTGNEYVWNRACGDDNWHTICGDKTSWLDEDDAAHMIPPGAGGNENVTIAMNSSAGVTLDQQDAQIGKLTAAGKLIVRKSLTLNQQSSVESLVLDSLESQIVANAKLTLTGDESVFQAGTITINSDDGVVNEGTVTVEPFVFASPSSFGIGAKDIATRMRGQGTPTVVFNGTGPFVNFGPATFVQQFDIQVDNTKKGTAILNDKRAVWQMRNGCITAGPSVAEARFTNRGELVKPAEQPSNVSTIEIEFEGKEGSTIKVEDGTLTMLGGGTFEGSSSNSFLIGETSTLRLGSPASGDRRVYQVLSGTVRAATIQDFKAPLFAVDQGTTLSIVSGATFVSELFRSRESERGGFELNDGGEVFVAGTFRNRSRFAWNGGHITTSDASGGAAMFLNLGIMSIDGNTTKTLTGRFANGSSGNRNEVGEVTLHETLEFAEGAKFENRRFGFLDLVGDATVTANSTAGSDALLENSGALRVRLSDDTSTDKTATVAVRFDNSGSVTVGGGKLVIDEGGGFTVVSPAATETLRMTGGVVQLDGTTLSGGEWTVAEKGVLDLGGGAIKQLGKAGGPRTVVSLWRDGVLRNFELERIEEPGVLVVRPKQSLILPGALDMSGGLLVTGPDAGLRINGDFDQRGYLRVDALSDFGTGNIPRIQVTGGNVTFHEGSKSIINGDLKMFTPKTSVIVKGVLFGSGNINGLDLQVIVDGGKFTVGKSPGTLTLDADYIQLANGTLEIEIGGTDAGDNQDLLVINGNADIAGKLTLKFIDDFSPTTGQTFDFLSVSGTQTGNFQNVEIVDLAPGFEFEITPTAGGMMMTAMSDGVFTGIPGEINDVNVGFNSPGPETSAATGDVDVPMLQFEVAPGEDGIFITSLTLSADGSGNDAIDLAAVTVWVDEDGDGSVGAEEMSIGSRTYDLDNGTLNLSIDPPLEVAARETATLLVAYDLAGAGADAAAKIASEVRASGVRPSRPASRFSVGLAAWMLPLVLGLGFVTVRRPKVSVWLCLAFATIVLIDGCGSGGTTPDPDGTEPDPVATAVTFRVTLTAIGAAEIGTGADASVNNLSLAGTNLTVLR